MTRFQYQILQYRPFAFPGEWVAVGVLVYAPSTGRLRFAATKSTSRARGLFAGLDLDGLRRHLGRLGTRFAAVAKGFEVGDANVIPSLELRERDLGDLSRGVLPDNDASLQFGPVVEALDVDMDEFFADLRKRVLEDHVAQPRARIDDKQVWRTKFNDVVGAQALVGFKPSYEVATGINPLSFDFGLQNGRLHLVEPTSFDMEPESIAPKLERRYGRYSMLAAAPGNLAFRVYVPLFLPDGGKKQPSILRAFASERFGDRVDIRVYEPKDAERLREDLLGVER